MTIDEFHLLPRKLGWKFEYYGGKAHISPQLSAIVATKVVVEGRTVDPPCEIRPVTEDDLPLLLPAYVTAFRNTIEYCDWKLAAIKEAALRNLQNYFSDKRGKALPASYVAIDKEKDKEKDKGKIVGAALINEPREGKPLLYLLFVTPQWHRRGVANALVSAGVNDLNELGFKELGSRYMLGNQGSRDWHHRFGFKDQIDQYLIRANYYYYDDELKRHQLLNDFPAEGLDLLIELRDYWHAYLGKMEHLPYFAAAAEDFG